MNFSEKLSAFVIDAITALRAQSVEVPGATIQSTGDYDVTDVAYGRGLVLTSNFHSGSAVALGQPEQCLLGAHLRHAVTYQNINADTTNFKAEFVWEPGYARAGRFSAPADQNDTANRVIEVNLSESEAFGNGIAIISFVSDGVPDVFLSIEVLSDSTWSEVKQWSAAELTAATSYSFAAIVPQNISTPYDGIRASFRSSGQPKVAAFEHYLSRGRGNCLDSLPIHSPNAQNLYLPSAAIRNGDGSQRTDIGQGTLLANQMPEYADEATGQNSALIAGSFYTVTGSNAIYRKSSVLSLSSGEVGSVAADQVVLTYPVPLDETSVPATSDYSLSPGRTINTVTVSGQTVTLGLASGYTSGNTVRVTFTPPGTNPVKGTDETVAEALVSELITNNI